MSEQLAQFNYHSAPGDILLLRGQGKGALNRGGQALRRLQAAGYTHVAVVVDRTRIVDAMPKLGVSFRTWHDVEHQYEIDRCRIARNMALATDRGGFAKVQKHAAYYVNQPYRLHTAVLPAGPIKDQRGLVCSHFVAALMHRVGLKVSHHAHSATLPVDIDQHTRQHSGWRQFPLAECELYSSAPRPPQDHPYWKALRAAAAPIALTAEQQARATAMADEIDNAMRAGRADALDEWLRGADAAIEQGKLQHERTMALFNESIQTQYDASRALKQFEQGMLELSEGLARGSPEALRISLQLMTSHPAFGGAAEPMNGAFYLRQWQAWYPDEFADQAPLFLHDEDRADRVKRHRDLLDRSIDGARTLTKRQLELFERFQETLSRYMAAAQAGQANVEWMLALRTAASSLLEGAWFVGGETLDDLNARIDSIPALQQGLLRVAEQRQGAGEDILRAGDVLIAIGQLDLDQRMWRTVAQPMLNRYVAIFDQSLAAGAGTNKT